MKLTMARETLLAYPDYNKPLDVHTDASHTQLGACVSQNGKPIAFHSRKLNLAQACCATAERESLSAVETQCNKYLGLVVMSIAHVFVTYFLRQTKYNVSSVIHSAYFLKQSEAVTSSR